jgi:hypothetical protein
MSDDLEQEDYKVGYRMPPKHCQFRKGVSGNPSGRRKKAPDLESLLLRELESKLIITEEGKRKKVRKIDVIIKQFVNKAATLHSPTFRLLFPYLQQALQKRAENDPRALDKANQDLRELTREELMFIAAGGLKKPIPDDSDGGEPGKPA